MSEHCISIQKKGLVDLVKALNNCAIKNINKFETPVNCLYNHNNASIVGVDPSAKTFAVIDQQTNQQVVVGSHELMRNFKKREPRVHPNDILRDLSEMSVSTRSPTNNFTGFDTSLQENPAGVRATMSSMDGGDVVDISKYNQNNDVMNQLSDYFSASTSIEEGLCE